MKPERNRLEWLVFALSLVLLLSVAAYLGRSAWLAGHELPQLELSAGNALRCPTGFMVEVTVRNRGDQTAESVEVEGTLKPPRGDGENSSFTLEAVPRRTQESGWMVFRTDPGLSPQGLQLRVVGFSTP